MILGERDNLAPRLANVAPCGESVTDRREKRLLAQILLQREIAMEPIAIGEFHIDVGSPLIDIHRRDAGTPEESAALRIGEIARRDKVLDKRLHGSVTRGCDLIQLGLVQNERIDREALA